VRSSAVLTFRHATTPGEPTRDVRRAQAPASDPPERDWLETSTQGPTLRPMTNSRDSISVERIIPASPQRIFDVLADPARHPEVDGSSSVKAVTAGAPARLSMGATFQMSMKRGIGYSMVNTVTEFEENRRIAWSPKPASGRGARFVGRIWRYTLEPVDGGTKVTETWDISKEALRFVLRLVAVKDTRKAMEKSLVNLEALAALP
jgi:uncharacterized protein YndB with AHSA1/START domain